MSQMSLTTRAPCFPGQQPQRRSLSALPRRPRLTRTSVAPQALALPPAAAVLTPLVGTAHFFLANPLMQLSMGGIAACAAVELAKARLPEPPKKGLDWPRIATALVGASVPVALLLAARAGLNTLGVPPMAITADMVRETGCAALAGLQLALFGTGVQAHFYDSPVDELLAPMVRRAVAAAVLVPIAYHTAVQYAAVANIARMLPTAVLACSTALWLGTNVLPNIGDALRGRRGYN